MKIIIDIPAEDFEKVKCGRGAVSMMRKAIIHGTPLPKGHGRLIDADDLIQELSVVSSRPVKSQLYILREAPTIIEADTESEDKE